MKLYLICIPQNIRSAASFKTLKRNRWRLTSDAFDLIILHKVAKTIAQAGLFVR